MNPGPVGRVWAVRTAVAGTVFIAAGAFWLSFTALSDLARRSGIAAGQAWAWPLIVDGIIVVATVAVVALARQRTAWYPWTLLVGGAAISVTANSIHALLAADTSVPAILAAAVAAVPPIVLLAITHLTVILTHNATALPVVVDPAPPAAALVSRPSRELPRLAHPVPAHHRAAPGPKDTMGEPLPPQDIIGTTEVDDPPELLNGLASANTEAGKPVQESSGQPVGRRETAAQLRAAGVSNKQIARELGVHPSTVGRWFTTPHTNTTTDTQGEY